MTTPPRTLIQIHYHNRVGGVTTVMSHYARAFAQLTHATPANNLIVCACPHRGVATLSQNARIVSMPYLAEKDFASLAAYERMSAKIERLLENLISDSSLPRPIAVIGHNLTLGKNPALSSAFMRCARFYAASKDDVRFFSVIHDFAEEGRLGLLQRIDRLERWGAKVWRDLYSNTPQLRYVVLNRRDQAALAAAGIRAEVLPNAVDIDRRFDPLEPAERAAIRDALASLADADGIHVFSDAAWYFLPSRIIGRKNIVEAIIVACLVLRGNLIAGVVGSSPADRRLHREIVAACRRWNLPVVLDAPRVRTILPRRLADEDPFDLFYRFCDACVTTSVSEGFGYALFEPWLFGKVLVGRLPCGTDAANSLYLPGLYSSLLIPASWVCWSSLDRKYRSLLGHVSEPCRRKQARSTTLMKKVLVRHGSVDFATLDVENQLGVLNRLVYGKPFPRGHGRKWMHQSRRLVEAASNMQPIASNRITVRKNFSTTAFCRRFGELLQMPPLRPRRADVDPAAVRNFFCRPSRIKLLLADDDVSLL